MRVACAHDRAAILKNLHMLDPGNGFQLPVLVNPDIQDASYLVRRHQREREIVPFGEANHAADSVLRSCNHQAMIVDYVHWSIRPERRKIVVENESAFVAWVARSCGTGISGTEIALQVVSGRLGPGSIFNLSLPRPVGA